MTVVNSVHKVMQQVYSEANDKNRFEKLSKECESEYDWKSAHGASRPFLTPKELGKILGVSIKTLQRWRSEGEGPKFIKVGNKRIRYSFKDLDRWVRIRTPE